MTRHRNPDLTKPSDAERDVELIAMRYVEFLSEWRSDRELELYRLAHGFKDSRIFHAKARAPGVVAPP